MKLVFDNIIFYLQKAGGISVVWYELLNRFVKFKMFEYFFIEDKNCLGNILRKNITIEKNYIVKQRFNTLSRYLDVSLNIKDKFIFHSSYYRICNNPHAINITTVHDFTYEYYFHGIKKILHTWQKRRAIKKANFIICISENTKKDLLKFIPSINKENIKVIYNGVSDDYFVTSKEESLNIPFKSREYILFVGARDSYKNFNLAVESAALYNKNIVIIGAPLTQNESLFINKTFNYKNKYFCTGRISNNELNVLYNNAFALLYPSIYEGFGIPVIEAQKAGCPVIAYNGSSIPEIIGDRSLLLNNLSVHEICKHLKSLENEDFRNSIIKKGLENSKRFSWDNTYIELLKVYEYLWKS